MDLSSEFMPEAIEQKFVNYHGVDGVNLLPGQKIPGTVYYHGHGHNPSQAKQQILDTVFSSNRSATARIVARRGEDENGTEGYDVCVATSVGEPQIL